MSVTVPLDQPIRLMFRTFSDAAATVPADATAVTVTIRDTAGLATPYTLAASQVVRETTGVYHFDYTPPAAGDYAAHWKATGTVTTARDQLFTVLAAYDALVSVDDFALYLNNSGLDRARAAFILSKAQQLCETVAKPLPAGADTVVLDVAERAFANPTSSGSSSPAYYAEGEGPFSDTTPGFSGGGLYLTKGNKATLRRLNGSGTAFSIDMLPASLPSLPPWDSGQDVTLLDLP